MKRLGSGTIETARRLALGIVLIAAASMVLLLSDLQNRQRVRRKLPRVAVYQIVSRPTMDESVRGVIEGLKDRGYIDGRTIRIDRFNAEADLNTASSIAQAIVQGGYTMVITISTPALQTMASANREGKLVHVFGTVTDPAASGVGISRTDSMDRPKHLVGIGTFQPVKEVFRLASTITPQLSKVGVVWCTSEACSEACVRLAREVCAELGITLLEANVEISIDTLAAARSLVSRGAQALWLGGDNVVETGVGLLIKAANEGRVPVFTNNPFNVNDGALFGLGADYYQVGRVTAGIAADVLDGSDPSTIPVENVVPRSLGINLEVPRTLHDHWVFSPQILKTAQVVAGRPPSAQPVVPSQAPAATSSAARRPPWKIHFIHYVESTFSEDAEEGAREEFKKLGLTEGVDYTLAIGSAQGQLSVLGSLIDSVVSQKADLIMTTSTQGLQAVAGKVKDLPVVFGNVADPVLAGVATSDTDHQSNVTGVSAKSDYDGMARAIKECLPGARRVGTLFVPAEVNSVYNKDALAASFKKAGIELIAVPVDTATEVPDAALALMTKQIDAVAQVMSSLLDNSFPTISHAAHSANKPLFTFTSGIVEKTGGAAVAIARDYVQVGRDMTDLAVEILRGRSPRLIPIKAASKTLIVINLDNARAFKLKVPASLLKRADRVIGH